MSEYVWKKCTCPRLHLMQTFDGVEKLRGDIVPLGDGTYRFDGTITLECNDVDALKEIAVHLLETVDEEAIEIGGRRIERSLN